MCLSRDKARLFRRASRLPPSYAHRDRNAHGRVYSIMTSRHKRWPIALCLTALAFTTTRAQDDAGDLAALVKALDIHAGSVVADIGAGPEGLLTIPLAHLVGRSGHVY